MKTSPHTTGTALTRALPDRLVAAVARVERRHGLPLYVTGGTVRDWLLARPAADLDMAVRSGAIRCGRLLRDELGGGALVELGTDADEAVRVVWQGDCVDFSAFRKQAATIAEELHHRDFTINAMAVELRHVADVRAHLIDPLGGLQDLAAGRLRCCPAAFADDPLRMLRGFRLQAELGFSMDEDCLRQIGERCGDIVRCARERIHGELERIMRTPASGEVVRLMAETGLLFRIVPELRHGVGLEQPGYHHEDVFHHSVLTLQCLERVMARPGDFFDRQVQVIEDYLLEDGRRRNLRWAALFHDIGKPATACLPETDGRITFYSHDVVGRRIFAEIANRLRMSRNQTAAVAMLIEMHMHPFHLSNVRRTGELSRRALLRICKKAGEHLPGLFLLAMADSLAGQGELKPSDMEGELAALFDEVREAYEHHVQPALHGERLLTGHDLQDIFHLRPGPRFKVILEELEMVQVEGRITTRAEALDWLRAYLERDS